MRTTLFSTVIAIAGRLSCSAWAALLLKGVGFAVLLLALGALGSGALDRWLTAAPAFGAVHRPGDSNRPSGKLDRAVDPARDLPAPSPVPGSPRASAAASSSADSTRTAIASDGRVILNLAAESDLVGLPGVGPKKAKAIIELRTKLGGRFKRLEDLSRIRGIKRKFLDRLRPRVLLDPP